MVSAMTNEPVWSRPLGSSTNVSTADSMRWATAGSATAPRPSDAIVMPSWAPASCNDSSRVAPSASRAEREPSAARVSSFVRREAMSANSTATKNPLANSSRAASNSSPTFTVPPP